MQSPNADLIAKSQCRFKCKVPMQIQMQSSNADSNAKSQCRFKCKVPMQIQMQSPNADSNAKSQCRFNCKHFTKVSFVPQLMPAINFHMPDEDLSTRFCFVCFDGQKTLDAIKSLREATGGSAGGYRDVALTEDFVKEHCGHLVEGVQALKKWCLQ